MFAWHYLTLCYVAINEASFIVAEVDQLLDATIVASLAILLSSSVVTHMHKTPGPKIRVMVTMIMAIKNMVVVMVKVMGKSMVKPMPQMPTNSRGI